MIKKVFFLLCLLIMPIDTVAAHKYEEYVDVSTGQSVHEMLHEGHLPIILNMIYNKRNERLNETSKQNLELSSMRKFGSKDVEHLKSNIVDKEDVKLRLDEYKDYYLKVPGDNNKFLRLQFDLVMGDKGKGFLRLVLTRFTSQRGFQDQTVLFDKEINLKDLAQEKKKVLEAIKLNIVVDGPKMEASKVEAVPVFKEDNGQFKATPVRPS